MCGRFSLFLPLRIIRERFKAKGAGAGPSYNIAPSQNATVILNTAPGELTTARWGLVPHWSKTGKTGYSMINARAETLAEKPAFRKLLEEKRCLVPADGFYEWKQTPRGKQPYRIEDKRGLFAFAGLWDEWKSSEGDPLRTFTIVTTAPNQEMRPIHDRMPVMLEPDEKGQWLEDGVDELLEPLGEGLLDIFPVSRGVNSPGNNSPDVVKPSPPGLAGFY